MSIGCFTTCFFSLLLTCLQRDAVVFNENIVHVGVGHFRNIALHLDPPLLQPNGFIAKGAHGVDRMADKQYGAPALHQLAHARHALVLEPGITDTQCLIHNQYVRLNVNDNGEGQARKHTAGIGLDRLMNKITDIGKGKNIVQFGVCLLSRQAQYLGAHVDVFDTCEFRIKA
ncbi:hypothetical protein D3C84_665740 [compost metagenome]